MDNTEKVEIGYTVPKERWIEAAKNLEDLGMCWLAISWP